MIPSKAKYAIAGGYIITSFNLVKERIIATATNIINGGPFSRYKRSLFWLIKWKTQNYRVAEAALLVCNVQKITFFTQSKLMICFESQQLSNYVHTLIPFIIFLIFINLFHT